MEISQKIILARKKIGLTQEELADRAKVTVRTIQRIESGESSPRAFTMKALADALDIQFEELAVDEQQANSIPPTDSRDLYDPEEEKHFLKTICLSCFSYLLIPVLHFLVPMFLFKKSGNQDSKTRAFARTIIREQIYWVVAVSLVLMLTLAYNVLMKIYFNKAYLLPYLLPFFIMYFLNAFLIFRKMGQINKLA